MAFQSAKPVDTLSMLMWLVPGLLPNYPGLPLSERHMHSLVIMFDVSYGGPWFALHACSPSNATLPSADTLPFVTSGITGEYQRAPNAQANFALLSTLFAPPHSHNVAP